MKDFKDSAALSAHQQTAGLQSANLEVTQKCDSRCISCNIWQIPNKPLSNKKATDQTQELSFMEHVRVLDELKALGTKAVQLHGGEPLLNARLAELVAHCSSSGIFTGISTNGLSMTPEKAKALTDAGLGSIKFSLDGPEDLHNHLRGRKDAFVKQIRAIELMQNSDPDQKVYKSIRSNVSSVNLERIDEVIDIAKALGIKDIQFAFYSVIDEDIVNESNDLFNSPIASLRSLIPAWLLPGDVQLIENKRDQMLSKADRFGISLGKTRFFTLPADQISKGIKRERTKCTIFNHSLTIDAFGETIPCEYLRFSLGNIKEKSLNKILLAEPLKTFKKIYSDNYQHLRICDYCCYSL